MIPIAHSSTTVPSQIIPETRFQLQIFSCAQVLDCLVLWAFAPVALALSIALKNRP